MSDPSTRLAQYRLLGRSGLRVSPLSLGTMTFGQDWGCDAAEAGRILDRYAGVGGNFVDTANFYAEGRSESILGELLAGRRNRIVLATKYSMATVAGDPNSGGNHRLSMMRGVEDSLKRLRTDHIDLFYLHVWDATTPPEEVMRGLDDLVRQGKIVYCGISDTPAWQVSRMQTIADLRGWSPLVALQIEYSLLQRTVERELMPMAVELGLGVLPWSPLGSGVLSGKYLREAEASDAGGRRAMIVQNGRADTRSLAIARVVQDVADEIGRSAAQVALAWTLVNPAVVSPILGVRTLAQLEDNLGALEVFLDPPMLERLEAASRVELGFPHDFLGLPFVRHNLSGGASIRPR